MKHTSGKKISLEELEAMSRHDKRRMIVMGLGVVLLGAGVIGGQMLVAKYEDAEGESQAAGQVSDVTPRSDIYMPPFTEEDRAVLDGIQDTTPEERMIPNQEVKQMLLAYTTLLTDRHYDEKLGVVVAGPEAIAAALADPGSHRMEAWRMWGTVESLGRFTPEGAAFPEFRGELALEAGGRVSFAVGKDPALAEVEQGSFVKLDGLFLQAYRTEIGGEWQDLPLLCGRELTPSVAHWAHDEERLMEVLARVEDDTIDQTVGIPEDAQWALLAKCEAGEEAWDDALELDSDTLTSVYKNPSMYRGRPFRFPISRNMGLGAPVYGENPLRIRALTTGWIGNQTWLGPAPVVKWIAATDGAGLLEWDGASRFVEARGYFLKNQNYEARDGRPLRAPVFVLESVAPFFPEEDGRPRTLMFGMLGGTLALIALFWALLQRDRKESDRMRDEMLRRRRERRAKQQSAVDSPA